MQPPSLPAPDDDQPPSYLNDSPTRLDPRFRRARGRRPRRRTIRAASPSVRPRASRRRCTASPTNRLSVGRQFKDEIARVAPEPHLGQQLEGAAAQRIGKPQREAERARLGIGAIEQQRPGRRLCRVVARAAIARVHGGGEEHAPGMVEPRTGIVMRSGLLGAVVGMLGPGDVAEQEAARRSRSIVAPAPGKSGAVQAQLVAVVRQRRWLSAMPIAAGDQRVGCAARSAAGCRDGLRANRRRKRPAARAGPPHQAAQDARGERHDLEPLARRSR